MDEYPYEDSKGCVKCRHPYIEIAFCPDLDHCKCHLIRTSEDHIECTCKRCGFTWAERTRDKKEK